MKYENIAEQTHTLISSGNVTHALNYRQKKTRSVLSIWIRCNSFHIRNLQKDHPLSKSMWASTIQWLLIILPSFVVWSSIDSTNSEKVWNMTTLTFLWTFSKKLLLVKQKSKWTLDALSCVSRILAVCAHYVITMTALGNLHLVYSSLHFIVFF